MVQKLQNIILLKLVKKKHLLGLQIFYDKRGISLEYTNNFFLFAFA